MNARADRTRVLITIPVLLTGGTEQQTLNLALSLKSAGFAVTVCCYYVFDAGTVEQFRAAGIAVLLMKYERAKGLLYLLKGLVTVIKEISPDIVHVQYIAPGFVPIVAARFAGTKTVFATVHQSGRVYGFMPKLLLRTAAKLCTSFFCVSQAVEESWFGNSELFVDDGRAPRRRHVTIHNAVDIPAIVKAMTEADVARLKADFALGEGPIVGIVARIRREKGHEDLFEAVTKVLPLVPALKLLIVGSGPDEQQLREAAKRLALENHLVWAGQRSAEETRKLYSIIDVLAMPSQFEGFGLSAIEAMAASRPVVAYSVDGLIEVVEDGRTGYLVEAGDRDALAKALIEVVSDPERARAMGRRGHQRAQELFSLNRYRQLMIAAYRFYAPGDPHRRGDNQKVRIKRLL